MERATPAPAWQPLTFGGVASFARASFSRLFVVQLIVALLVALSVACAALSPPTTGTQPAQPKPEPQA